MTTLAPPTVVGERSSGAPNPYANCGQACVASVCTDYLSRQITDLLVYEMIRELGYDEAAGTTAEALSAALTAFGVANRYQYGVPMATYLPRALAAQHEIILLHQCDALARPVPAGRSQVRHWRVGYGDAINTMNPWIPTNETVLPATLYAADNQTHIEILGVMPKDLTASTALIMGG